MVDDDLFKQNVRIDGYPVIGTTCDFPALIEQKNIGVILYAISKISSKDQERILALYRRLPIRLVIVPDLIKMLHDHLLCETWDKTDEAILAK